MASLPGSVAGLPPIPGLWDGSPSDLVQKSASDTLDLSVTDSGSVPADANVVTGDTLDFTLDEGPIEGQGIEAADYLDVYLAEPSRWAFGVRRADDVTVSLTDSTVGWTGGQFGQDALDVSLDESAAYLVLIASADGIDLALAEEMPARAIHRNDSLSVGISDLVKVRAIAALDDLNISVTGSLNLSGAVRSLLRTDAFNVGFNDAIYRIRLEKSIGDTLDLTLDDASISFGDFTPISDLETLTISFVESASVVNVDFDTAWDSDSQPWGGPLAEEVAFRPVLPIGDQFYQVNPNVSTRAGTPLSSVLERIGIVPADPTNILLIRALHPLVRAQAGTVIKISVGMQDSPEDPITWQGPFNYVVGTSYFVDPVLSGRYISLRIETEGQPAWRILNLDLDLKEVGLH